MRLIAVIEDEKHQRLRTERFVRELYGEKAVIRTYASAEEFYVRSGREQPEIALIDVGLPGDSGLLLAQYLNRDMPGCQIIFLSGHLDYAVEAYRTRHIWYVTKDRMTSVLPEALHAAEKELKRIDSCTLVLQQKDGVRVLRQADVLYLERSRRTTSVVTAGGTVLCPQPLDELMDQLDHERFVRCHNSFVVNLQYIRHFQRTKLEMETGACVPVSRSFQVQLRSRFADFIGVRFLNAGPGDLS